MVTSTIAFEGDGLWREYEGGVQDWLEQSKRSKAIQASAAAAAVKPSAAENSSKNSPLRAPDKPEQLSKKKLSYKEQRELEQLPAQITALETEQQVLQEALADGSLYSKDPARAAEMATRAATIDDELMAALERWTELSA